MGDLRTYDDRDGWIWLDGKLVPWREANVHVLTHALHYASSVFEGQRAYGGEVFKLTEHSTRLRRSAELLGFEIPWTVEQIDEACREVWPANRLKDAYIRPLAWRGSGQMACPRSAPRSISPSPPGNGAPISATKRRRRGSGSTSRPGGGPRPTPP